MLCKGCCDASEVQAAACPAGSTGDDWSLFLLNTCERCTTFGTCERHPNLLAVAERLWTVATSFTSAGKLLPRLCARGALAAAVVRQQFGTSAAEATIRLLNESAGADVNDLAPWPLQLSQLELYATMQPAAAAFCDEGAAPSQGQRLFVPFADLRQAGQSSRGCAVQRSDAQVLKACRSRRQRGELFPAVLDQAQAASLRAVASDLVRLPPPLAPLNETPASDSSSSSAPPPWLWDSDLRLRRSRFSRLRCPKPEASLATVTDLQDMQKYEERVADGGCQSGRGVWGKAFENNGKCVLMVVAERLGFQPGQLLLDWGSGCGHALTWAKMFFDVDGLGLEATSGAADWAAKFAAGLSCKGDGRQLTWVPDGLFDYVFTYAALLHLSEEDQCSVAVQLVRKLRPGGRAFFGWNRAHLTSPWSWYECFRRAEDRNVVKTRNLEVVEEHLTFPASAGDENALLQDFMWGFPSYSVFVERRS
eukprot:TRINITY_DN40889_c0_g1_i1.p1 TRINITY_DN40889_c0_g1~~TRINITY_DN40889_c0_g1_i1.p1  ORF type:complete len:478 (+),score=50.39 TRINITY_DN40889_c0_g1_i1:114-1547(+)